MLGDSNFVRCPSQQLVPSKTVFVGALHGMLNAEAVAVVMNDLFGGVMYAGIDTDKHKYPIGRYSGDDPESRKPFVRMSSWPTWETPGFEPRP